MKNRDKNTFSRRRFLQVAGAGIAGGTIGFPAIVHPRPKTDSMIVLGIDGMDPGILQIMLKSGRMPSVARLIEKGSFTTLATSDPPQSPVAWSNFISGTNPGGHGIFDFIARDPATITPYLSTSNQGEDPATLALGKWELPLAKRQIINLRQGPTFWQALENRGIDCTVFRMPANFPPSPGNSRTISGLGTPDIHGSYGSFTLYTDASGQVSQLIPGGRISRIVVLNGAADCVLHGPSNTLAKDRSPVDIPFKVYIDPSNGTALIKIQNTETILVEGNWTDWINVDFKLIPHLASAKGICRFFLKSVRNEFQLYMSPVNIDPADPAMPISTPPDYSRVLSEETGSFYTQGMPLDTRALSAHVLNDDEYRQQAHHVLEDELRLYQHELARFESGFLFFYFSSLDLNSHMFWRTMDAKHPLYSRELKKDQGDFLPMLYEKMDNVIGMAMARTQESTRLAVVSDHGFASFRRQFNLNSWLADNGYAALTKHASRGSVGYFADTDWKKTRAYGLGINSLYLNMKGREPNGVVSATKKDELAAELVKRLTAIRDPESGKQIISHAYRPQEIYSGPYTKDAPDIIVCYNRTYRASWDTVLGKYPKDIVLDNLDPWSGDHAMDAALVPGILLSDKKIKANKPALSDMAPSILNAFGVPLMDGMTGKVVM